MTPTRLFAYVAFPIPLDKQFTYEVPEELQELIREGSRVLAPFGTKK